MDLLRDLTANPGLEAFIPSTCLAGDMTTSHTGAQLYLLLGSPEPEIPWDSCGGSPVPAVPGGSWAGVGALVSRGAWGPCPRPSHQQGQAEEARLPCPASGAPFFVF